MTKLWTHPNFIGGCSGSSVRSKRVAPTSETCSTLPAVRKVPISLIPGIPNDFLIIFTSASLLSAVAVLAIFFHCSDIGAENTKLACSGFFSDGDVHSLDETSGRESFLAGMLSEQAYDIKRQIHFVSSVIQSHLDSLPNPDLLASMIVSESFKANYDPLFVAAVVRSESMFRGNAVSGVGARGLMQIMPETGKYLSKKENIRIDGPGGLHDPHTNLKLGIAYLKYLEAKFNGNRTRALIAYNWGPANLEQALKSRNSVPASTLQYAQKILSTHRKWKSQFTQVALNGGRILG